MPNISGLESIWAESRGRPEVVIAVLDGPVDLTHPCFEGAHIDVHASILPNTISDGPACSHGTHVASLIFGQPDSSVEGVAPGCSGLIIPTVMDGPTGIAPCSQLDLARSITLAVELGASVINISAGQFEPSGEAHPTLADAVRFASESNVQIVAAAGNDGCACLHVPAAIPSVLVVGAMDEEGLPLDFSNWGEAYQEQGVLAPGLNLAGAVPGGGSVAKSGTSFATPLVSGLVGLLASWQLEEYGNSNTDEIRDAILETALDCEDAPIPNCSRLMKGRINAVSALEAMQGDAMFPEEQNQTPPESTAKEAATPILSQASASHVQHGCSVEPSQSATPTPQVRTYVYVLGQIGFDFGSEARRDSFTQLGIANPYDPSLLVAHHKENPSHAEHHIWTLSQEGTPVYALQPLGPFARDTYALLCEFLESQITEGVERVSVAGVVRGSVKMQNGQTVPALVPDIRGLYSWSTEELVKTVAKKPTKQKSPGSTQARRGEEITNFLNRIYHETRNLGLSSQERAINYAVTNLYQVGMIYSSVVESGLKFDGLYVDRSSFCRPESDCWEVRLHFFDVTTQGILRKVYTFTIDVSDTIPVTVGEIKTWQELIPLATFAGN